MATFIVALAKHTYMIDSLEAVVEMATIVGTIVRLLASASAT